jgi:hypothetical protein
MTVTATAKRRRSEARMINGRKASRLDKKRMLIAQSRTRKK